MRKLALTAVLLSTACGGEGGGDGSGTTAAPTSSSTAGESDATRAEGPSTGVGTLGGSEGTTLDPPGSTGADSTSGDSASTDETSGGVGLPEEGTLRVLTYNVAGLPDLISGSDPAVNTPMMSPLLNAFDHVLVQEDFSYHDELSADAMHPYQSTPGGGGTLGDGLNRFSDSAFADFERHAWEECNGIIDSGNDCLTMKGFSVATHQLGPIAQVDIYNLHMDAGGSAGDIQARQAQVQQLLDTIAARSADRAIIVAGDTNMNADDEPDVQTLLTGASLLDACRELACGEDNRIDRIMFRSSATVELVPTSWAIDPTFVNGMGEPLSDHEPVVVEFDWAQL